MAETGETVPDRLVPGLYRIVPDRSAVRMTVRGVAGRIAAEVPIEAGQWVVGAAGRITEVRAVLDARSLQGDGPMVTRALRGRSGLDVARFATVTFSSTAVPSGGPTLDIEGLLTMRGVSYPARFRGEITRVAGRRIALRVEGAIDRTRYGVTVGRPLYAKEATVRIRAIAVRA